MFSPPVTFADATVIDAADILASNDALREYLEKLEDAAFLATPFVGPQHIMRGQYLPTINQAHMVSGIYEGHVFTMDASDYTYATCYNTRLLSSTVERVIPLTAMSLEIRQPASILFNWWLQGAGRYNTDGTSGGLAHIYPFMGTSLSPSLSRPNMAALVREEASSAVGYPHRNQRYSVSGFRGVNAVGPLTYHVGVKASVPNGIAKVQFLAFGVTAEIFYI